MTRIIVPSLALLMASCIVVAKPASGRPQPAPEPVRHHLDPKPPPAPGVPPGAPVYEASLKLKYDAALDDCYDAARKALGIMKFSEADLDKKTGVITGHLGSIFARASMYRRNHHTYLTFYFRVHGHRADARMPGDFAKRSHETVAKEVKEVGRKTD